MISHIEGTIIAKTNHSLILQVEGVGYEVRCIPLVLEKASTGEAAAVFTHLYSREDIMELYGFESLEQLTFFRQMIEISGIGPKSALMVLALATVSELKDAIARGDASLLTKVSGIGKKTAERLIVELKSKIESESVSGSDATNVPEDAEVLDGLVGLGYSLRDAREALQSVDASVTGVKARLTACLKILGKQ